VDVPLMTDLLPGKPDPDAIRAVLAARYAGSPIVNFVGDFDESLLTIEHAAGSDRLDLFVFANADGTRVRLTAALDNLGKGASGAAVQSLNLIAGLDETAGLKL
jgi:N-acetyl-gamma-glutamyl-phosphate reductase